MKNEMKKTFTLLATMMAAVPLFSQNPIIRTMYTPDPAPYAVSYTHLTLPTICSV